MTIADYDKISRFLINKQHLTERTKTNDILKITGDIFGLHTTSPTTPYLSLFQRTTRFTTNDLDNALYVNKTLVKMRCVRQTMYVVPKELIPVIFQSTRKMVDLSSERYRQFMGVSDEEYQTASSRIMQILKGKGLTAAGIRKELGLDNHVPSIVNLMCDRGLVSRGKPLGWKSSQHTYYRFDEYYPDIDLDSIGEADAQEVLVKKYISVFGPVAENDISWWTGLTKTRVMQIIKDLKNSVVRSQNMFITTADMASLDRMKSDGEPQISLLPSLDPLSMGYKTRDRYLEPEFYNYIYDRTGNSTSTILINGQISGVWDCSARPFPICKYWLFKQPEIEIDKIVRDKLEAIAGFLTQQKADIKKCSSMIPLTQRTAGGVMSPLSDS